MIVFPQVSRSGAKAESPVTAPPPDRCYPGPPVRAERRDPRCSRSRSVNPGSWIPGTVPLLEYCQIRHVVQPDGMAGLAAVV